MPIDQKAQHMSIVLRFGSRDRAGETAVADWQTTLARLGWPPGPTDGVFGQRTEHATQELQRAAWLRADGVVGDRTREAAQRIAAGGTGPGELIEAIDVSSYQGRIDWPRVAAAGKRAAWLRLLTETGSIDARFAENWCGAMAAGLRIGAYLFLAVERPAEGQALAFLQALPAGGTLPPVVDVERGSHGGTPRPASVLACARIIEEGLRARGGERFARPIVYCSPSYAASYLQGAPAIGDSGLWCAHYGVAAPDVPPPWPCCAAWQSGTARVDGVAGPVDIDLIRLGAIDAL
jgi:lysozyme